MRNPEIWSPATLNRPYSKDPQLQKSWVSKLHSPKLLMPRLSIPKPQSLKPTEAHVEL